MRILLALIVLVWPTTGIAVPLSPFSLAIGVLLAYDGVTRTSVWYSLAFLFIAELLYDLGPGVLMVTYMVCALATVLVRQWLSISPFARESGWPLGALLRTIILGFLLALVATGVMTVISSVVYTHGLVWPRIASQFTHLSTLVGAAGLVSLFVVILARIDRPWRRPISYGV